MKSSLISLILIFSSLNSYSEVLDLKYHANDNRHTCPYDIMACPRDFNINDYINNSKLMTSDTLNSYLARDRERSIFIPLELTNSELITLAAATSLGVVAFKYDQEISDTIKSNNSKIANTLSSVGNFYGSGYGMGIVAAGSYFLGMYYDNNQLKRVGLFVIGAELAQAIVTTAVKDSFGRVRPSGDRGPYDFFEAGNKSFFSGHTATAFTLATVVSEMYKEDYPVVPYVAYGLAALTAYGRVHDNHHWASDVIIAAVAGHLIAKLALSSFNGDTDRGGLLFYPSIDPVSGTIMANFEWTPKTPEAPMKCAKMPEGNAKISACLEEAFNKSAKKKLF
jgi:membrane-associated phospholipid phosphatase